MKLSVIDGPSSPELLNWTFNDVLQQRLKQHPDNVVVYSQEQTEQLTYAELDRKSDHLAAGLYELGVRATDRVGLLLGNRSEYAVGLLACSKLGAYFTLFNYAYSDAEFINALKATTPKVLLATYTTSKFDYRSILDRLHHDLPTLQNIVLLQDISQPGEAQTSAGQWQGYMTYEQLMAKGARSQLPIHELKTKAVDSNILNLQFTSGSTGLPKVAALTQHGMLNSCRYIGQLMNIQPTDRINVPVPLFHAFGLVIGLCTAIFYGAAVVLPSEYYDCALTLQAMQKYRCTGLYGVATMFVDMLAHPSLDPAETAAVKFALLAGSAMPDGLLNRINQGFPSLTDIFTNWGMTELSSIATMTIASDPVEKKLKSAGRLLPHFTGKIVDPNTAKTLPWGMRGEIVISGFGVMHSYYNQPDKTSQAVRYHEEDAKRGIKQRWMHTGDEGYLDRDGYFVITGRIKDLIIRGGENISPIEIESRLYQHPAIKQCAVIAVPSPRYGEEVAAMLELNDSDSLQRPTDSEVRSWVRKELARYKAPSFIWWLGDTAAGVPEEWPKTANGKLRKDDIRKIAKDLLERGNVSQPELRASL